MKRNTSYWLLISVLSIFMISSGFACVSAPGSAPTAQPPQAKETEKKPASIEIISLTVKPATVMVDHPATVTATFINRGDIVGSYTVSLLIDGKEIDIRDVLVDPGVSKEVSFQVTRTTAGRYELRVGNSTARLTVCEWTPQNIQYDSGVHDPLVVGTYMWGGGGQIVHFTPPAEPFKIQKVSISAHTKVANYADLKKRMFAVRIWNENKTKQLWSGEFPWSLFETWGWQDIDIPGVIADGDFHVEVVTNSDAPPSENYMAISYEESKGELRSGISIMGLVVPPGGYAVKDKRWFIRVAGECPPETCVPDNYGTDTGEEVTNDPEVELTISSTNLVYEDDFGDSSSGWAVQSTENSDWYYEDGEYHGLVKSHNWASFWFSPIPGAYTDFTLETDGRLVSGPEDARYGLCFRLQNVDSFYVFLVSGNGYYLIGRRANFQWDVLRWTKSEFIEEGYAKNHLKVVCDGSEIAVYANGHLLTTVTDKSFADGRVGVIVDTIEPDAHVAFDNFKVYSPD